MRGRSWQLWMAPRFEWVRGAGPGRARCGAAGTREGRVTLGLSDREAITHSSPLRPCQERAAGPTAGRQAGAQAATEGDLQFVKSGLRSGAAQPEPAHCPDPLLRGTFTLLCVS